MGVLTVVMMLCDVGWWSTETGWLMVMLKDGWLDQRKSMGLRCLSPAKSARDGSLLVSSWEGHDSSGQKKWQDWSWRGVCLCLSRGCSSEDGRD
ncbi:uncharacterized protein M6B38_404355 [Iris pallida]|uniref:Secreted protein n=1 Tax=Iris pallida TaxID=29817 RepID=A0AAX6FRG1_IRIPA|nr:uncharacterized protein M6B38_404355 [Iris pallida]